MELNKYNILKDSIRYFIKINLTFKINISIVHSMLLFLTPIDGMFGRNLISSSFATIFFSSEPERTAKGTIDDRTANGELIVSW